MFPALAGGFFTTRATWGAFPSHHFMAIEEDKVETVAAFLFLSSKVTVDDDCSHEMKRCLFLERKAMTNLDSILQSRDITLLTACLVKAMVFPVVMYRCERWSIKKAEELMLSNCGVEEDSWESLGLQEG